MVHGSSLLFSLVIGGCYGFVLVVIVLTGYWWFLWVCVGGFWRLLVVLGGSCGYCWFPVVLGVYLCFLIICDCS